MSIGFVPNKTKVLNKIDIPDSFFADFLRGHLDGDGFTNSYWDKRWKSSFMLYTGFVSASKNHVEWIKDKVQDLYLQAGRIKYTGKSTYHLVYAKKISIFLLKQLYYGEKIPYLSRKKFKIDRSLSIITGSYY